MSGQDLRTFYETRKEKFSTSLQAVNKNITLISNARLILAVFFFVFLYYGFKNQSLLFLLPGIVVIFTILVRKHGRFFEEKIHLENLVKIQANELQALTHDYTCFPSGSEFIDPKHPYAHDLDMVGEGSIFQSINRSESYSGKQRFVKQLYNSLPNAESILLQQEAIKELSQKTEFRHHFQASGIEMNEQPHDRIQLAQWLTQPSFLYGKKLYHYLLPVFPAITVVLVIASFVIPQLKYAAIACAMTQWSILGSHMKKVNLFHDYISRKKNILQKYALMLKHISHENFTAKKLANLAGKAQQAEARVAELAKLVSALDARLNWLTNIVTNSLLLYDLQCIYKLERWKESNKHELMSWLEVISEMEMLTSFGTYAFNHPKFPYASIDIALVVQAKALGHPMIPQDECVFNDVLLGQDQSVLIITGANMAGKSTFLRTLGVNMVLALSGAPVCAETFSCPVIQLRSGMRTADSLKDHQSYFYAELNRLKTIMDELRSDKPLMILLDEILKGTNSTDKQMGSIELVKQLLPHPCLGIIATHDLALGDLENQYPGQIKNYCFEANIENNQLHFDYKLKRGLATKMNATFLMKKMGIIPA